MDLSDLDAVLFDIDGVVTDTARVHAGAWKRTFDDLLRSQARWTGVPMKPFDIRNDYLHHVDGRPRLDGVRGFLASRDITLPEGADTDPPGQDSIHGMAKQKNAYFLDLLRRHGVTAFSSTVDVVRELRRRGVRTAAVSASRNAAQVLEAAGVADLFDVRVDGQDSTRLELAGKPDPAMFLEAAGRLGIPPARIAVVEDALAGVEAGARGGFRQVVGVDRGTQAEDLRRSGADTVVKDLSQLALLGRSP
ncbi:MAG TPA: beta-phosphoglucomutase family hydrolase [Mycobacteriales bacterium]